MKRKHTCIQTASQNLQFYISIYISGNKEMPLLSEDTQWDIKILKMVIKPTVQIKWSTFCQHHSDESPQPLLVLSWFLCLVLTVLELTIDPAGLKLRDLPTTASGVVGLKTRITTIQFIVINLNENIHHHSLCLIFMPIFYDLDHLFALEKWSAS